MIYRNNFNTQGIHDNLSQASHSHEDSTITVPL